MHELRIDGNAGLARVERDLGADLSAFILVGAGY
jgi:hypothetical protein